MVKVKRLETFDGVTIKVALKQRGFSVFIQIEEGSYLWRDRSSENCAVKFITPHSKRIAEKDMRFRIQNQNSLRLSEKTLTCLLVELVYCTCPPTFSSLRRWQHSTKEMWNIQNRQKRLNNCFSHHSQKHIKEKRAAPLISITHTAKTIPENSGILGNARRRIVFYPPSCVFYN